MKHVLIILLFVVSFLLGIAISLTSKSAEIDCKKQECAQLTKYQEDCVIKKRCNKEIYAQIKARKAAEEKSERLQKELDNQSKLRNSVSLLVGRTPTNLEVEQTPTSFQAETNPEMDFGLMYQRDFTENYRVRGSLGVTVRGSAYLGLGINF